jgi:hypothetical protein
MVNIKIYWYYQFITLHLIMNAREIHAHEMHTYEMHAREVHAHEVHAHEVHAHEDLARQNTVAYLSQLQLRFRRRRIWVSVVAVVS